MSIRLSPRLQRIADYVPQGSTVIDVGTDHAYVPIWLLQSGRCSHAFASDMRPGPLQNAAADAEKAGVGAQLKLLLCDGLSLCPPDAVDTVIMAGLGGETIQRILQDAPWAAEKRLILQPQTKQDELRRYLSANRLAIADAALAYDTGRLYLVWLVSTGEMDGDRPLDVALLQKRDPLLRPYIEEQLKRRSQRLRGMEAARVPDTAGITTLRGEIAALRATYAEVQTWQSSQ
ncbi:MAG: class I SAM-dependent methyltransferase [Oscillospiraceae bacterium]|nr:class I SAM-dependent methyltransferase [Oscillospiraceae bacterium]MCD8239881.1 class I SAM-dependent methyltransferase [Oscillospiraceae bacterium]